MNPVTTSSNKGKTSSTFFSKNKKRPEFTEAVEEVKKLYQRFYASPNPLIASQIKTTKLNIYLNNFNFNDISVINKILSKYTYFENLTLSPYDPNKKNPDSISKRNSREPLTEGEKVKLQKQKHDAEIERKHLINKVTAGIGKHIALTDKLITFSLINFPLEKNLAEHLSKGIISNKSIQGLYVNNCQMSIESYEILLKGLLNHEKIEYLDLSFNNLEDKYGNMIARIIARQTYRRDQVIWLYGLRNEIPLNNDYTKGLISINLRGNKLSDYSAECITTSLASDQYVRYIDLSQNDFSVDACKQFIHMLRQNVTLLNIDLRENPGYDENIHTRIVMKMSKNIRHLYQQYQEGVYSEEEFENFKQFIDTSFFDLDIPQEIVEYYNNNLLETTDNNQNNLNPNFAVTKAMSDIKENDEYEEDEEEEEGAIKNNESKNSKSVSKSVSVKKSKTLNNNNNDSENTTTKLKQPPNKGNQKLMEENLLLKQQIIELKAKNLQSKLGKNINIPGKYDPKGLEKNYEVADDLINKLNRLMDDMKNNQSKSDVTEKKEKETMNSQKKNAKSPESEKKIEKSEKKEEIVEEVKNEEKKEKSEEKKDSGAKNKDYIECYEDGDEDEDINFDDLTEEQKLALLQQNQIIKQLQEEAEARGEKFDIQDYIAFLEEHNREEEEENDDDHF